MQGETMKKIARFMKPVFTAKTKKIHGIEKSN